MKLTCPLMIRAKQSIAEAGSSYVKVEYIYYECCEEYCAMWLSFGKGREGGCCGLIAQKIQLLPRKENEDE